MPSFPAFLQTNLIAKITGYTILYNFLRLGILSRNGTNEREDRCRDRLAKRRCMLRLEDIG